MCCPNLSETRRSEWIALLEEVNWRDDLEFALTASISGTQLDFDSPTHERQVIGNDVCHLPQLYPVVGMSHDVSKPTHLLPLDFGVTLL